MDGAIAREQQHPPVRRGDAGSEGRRSGIADGLPSPLGHVGDVSGQLQLGHPVEQGAGLHDDDISFLDELLEQRIVVGCRQVIIRLSLRKIIGKGRSGNGSGLYDLELHESIHHIRGLDAGIQGLSDPDVVRVDLNRLRKVQLGREAGRVGVGPDETDSNDAIRILYGLADGFLAATRGVHADIIGMGLVERAFAVHHRCCGKMELFRQKPDGILQAVSQHLHIGQQHRTAAPLQQPARMGRRLCEGGSRCCRCGPRFCMRMNRLGYQVVWKGQINGLFLSLGHVQCFRNFIRGVFKGNSRSIGGQGFIDLPERIEIPIHQGMMHEFMSGLVHRRRSADDVHHRNGFAVRAGDGVAGAELADPEGGEQGGYALQAGESIGGITGVQLVPAADEAQLGMAAKLVQNAEIIIAWNPEYVGYPGSAQAAEQERP
ncbi:hypothetical protein BN871_BM_00380 [Paenibacillus sp. P22]|nr:hypothetical protein BN871_BM_00380 [Paenibacillus sp. P22]